MPLQCSSNDCGTFFIRLYRTLEPSQAICGNLDSTITLIGNLPYFCWLLVHFVVGADTNMYYSAFLNKNHSTSGPDPFFPLPPS